MKNNVVRIRYYHTMVFALFCLFSIGIAPTPSFSQAKPDSTSELMKKAIRLYVDCSSCDEQFMRTELKFVNFVRDRNEAEVHILVTTQTTGSGGTEYTITFIGKERFEGENDTLLYNSQQSDTDEMTRKGLLGKIKIGLMRYVEKSPLADKIGISYTSPENAQEKVKDAWDYWVMSLNLNGYMNGQKTSNWRNLNGSLSATRTTPNLKLNFSVSLYDNKSKYIIDDTTTAESYSGSKYFSSLAVFSLSDHWSTGFSTSMSTSTYNNLFLSYSVAPAIEYDIFPYSEATRKQVRILEEIGAKHVEYYEQTIYDKTFQNLTYHNLSVSTEVKETWGTVSMSVYGSNYFFDLKKYRVQLYGSLSLRLIEGLSVNASGSWSKINDQLGLPRGEATPEEVLLQVRQMETNYEYYVSFGLTYSFGSIFNNVVNPRFGN